MAQKLLLPTTCRYCRETFYGPPEGLGGGTLIIGEEPNKRAKLYMASLMTHLETKHADKLKHARILGSEYAGMLALTSFETDDEGINQQRDFQRWRVHQQSMALRVTDERIRERLKATIEKMLERDGGLCAITATEDLFADNSFCRAIEDTMRLMRDVIEEVERYPTLNPGEAGEALSPS